MNEKSDEKHSSHERELSMPKEKEPKVGEFWWAWPPDGGEAQPVEIVEVRPTGNHVVRVLGRSDFGYTRQWTLERPVASRKTAKAVEK